MTAASPSAHRALFVGGPWNGRVESVTSSSYVLVDADGSMPSAHNATVYIPRVIGLAGTHLVTVMAPNTMSLPEVASLLSDAIHERFGIDR